MEVGERQETNDDFASLYASQETSKSTEKCKNMGTT